MIWANEQACRITSNLRASIFYTIQLNVARNFGFYCCPYTKSSNLFQRIAVISYWIKEYFSVLVWRSQNRSTYLMSSKLGLWILSWSASMSSISFSSLYIIRSMKIQLMLFKFRWFTSVNCIYWEPRAQCCEVVQKWSTMWKRKRYVKQAQRPLCTFNSPNQSSNIN